MVLVQRWPFFHLFFLGNIGQENVFYDILGKKNDFQNYKKKQLQYDTILGLRYFSKNTRLSRV